MNRSLIAVYFSILLLVSACVSGPTAGPVANTPAEIETESPPRSLASIDELPFAALVLQNDGSGQPVQSPVSGTLLRAETDELGLQRAIIRQAQRYYLNGRLQTLEFDFILGGLSVISANPGEIEAGEVLGLFAEGEDAYVSARTAELEDYIIRSSERKPVFYDGAWWAAPFWLIPTSTQWLSFRQADTLEAAVRDFYHRWASEEENADDAAAEDDGRVSYGTIHYYPELDRVRVRTILPDLPEPALRSSILGMTELNFYGRSGLFTLQNRFGFDDMEYDTMVYWQPGFDEYLAAEYTPGQALYLYCSIMSLDHENRLIVVLARDFALRSDEEEIAARRASILGD